MLRRYGVIFLVVSIGSLIACGGGGAETVSYVFLTDMETSVVSWHQYGMRQASRTLL